MRDQITRHLERARLATRAKVIGTATEVPPVVTALARTMEKIHRDRDVAIDIDALGLARFRGERQDLEEMVGNLVDNACKWAQSRVAIEVMPEPRAAGRRPSAGAHRLSTTMARACPPREREQVAQRGEPARREQAGLGPRPVDRGGTGATLRRQADPRHRADRRPARGTGAAGGVSDIALPEFRPNRCRWCAELHRPSSVGYARGTSCAKIGLAALAASAIAAGRLRRRPGEQAPARARTPALCWARSAARLLGSQFGGGARRASCRRGIAGAAVGGLIGNRIGAALDEEDRRRAYAAEMEALDEPTEAPVEWRSPRTGHYGRDRAGAGLLCSAACSAAPTPIRSTSTAGRKSRAAMPAAIPTAPGRRCRNDRIFGVARREFRVRKAPLKSS